MGNIRSNLGPVRGPLGAVQSSPDAGYCQDGGWDYLSKQIATRQMAYTQALFSLLTLSPIPFRKKKEKRKKKPPPVSFLCQLGLSGKLRVYVSLNRSLPLSQATHHTLIAYIHTLDYTLVSQSELPQISPPHHPLVTTPENLLATAFVTMEPPHSQNATYHQVVQRSPSHKTLVRVSTDCVCRSFFFSELVLVVYFHQALARSPCMSRTALPAHPLLAVHSRPLKRRPKKKKIQPPKPRHCLA